MTQSHRFTTCRISTDSKCDAIEIYPVKFDDHPSVCADQSKSSPVSKTHLVLMKGVRDVICHVARRMGQDDHHVLAGRGRGTQPVCFNLDK